MQDRIVVNFFLFTLLSLFANASVISKNQNVIHTSIHNNNSDNIKLKLSFNNYTQINNFTKRDRKYVDVPITDLGVIITTFRFYWSGSKPLDASLDPAPFEEQIPGLTQRTWKSLETNEMASKRAWIHTAEYGYVNLIFSISSTSSNQDFRDVVQLANGVFIDFNFGNEPTYQEFDMYVLEDLGGGHLRDLELRIQYILLT